MSKKQAVASAALQYSKWLSKFICWVWALYRFTVLIVAAIVPESADAVVSTIGTLDTIMIINEGTYLVNSLGEKYIYSDRFVLHAFKNGWFQALQTKLFKQKQSTSDENEDEDENPVEEDLCEEQEETTDIAEENG